MAGWLKLHRKILESQVFSDPDLLRLWIMLLCRANFKTSYFRGREIGVGQVAFSQRLFCDSLGVSKGKLHRDLNKLKAAGMLSIEAGRDFSVASICNWETYQGIDQDDRGADGAHGGRTGGADAPLPKKETIPQVKKLTMVDADHARWTESQIAEARWLIQTVARKLRSTSPLKASDRSLVIKAAVLSVKRFGGDWLHDAVNAALEVAGVRNKFSYLHECLTESTRALGFDFNQQLKRLDGTIPEPLLKALDEAQPSSPRLCAVGEI